MERSEVRFLLLQARNPGDPIRAEEHASFAHFLRVTPEQVSSLDLLSQPLAPKHLEGHHAILVGGAGEYSVIDPLPAVAHAMDFLARQADDGFPIFGSCFGFHLLVRGLGGEVVYDEENSQIGTFDLSLTPGGQADPLFSRLPEFFSAQEGHKDRAARLPAAAVNLATSHGCPFQAINLPGRPVYATQFHPELDDVMSKRRLRRYMENYAPPDAGALQEMLENGFWPSPDSSNLLADFMDVILLPHLRQSAP